jgi:SWI/SNF-related matrix-associated actin-dependent regulator 1 of chromatin subfamily A
MNKMHTLYDYQQEGISTLFDIVTTSEDQAALLADPPGAGKTPQAIGLANALKSKSVLIVCPASLRQNWAREVEKWSSFNFTIQVVLNGQTEIDETTDVVIISYHLAVSLHEKLSKRNFDLLICDESHHMKNPASNASRIVLVLLWSRCKYRLLITGTPLPNGRANEAWTTFSRCSQKHFGDWKKYSQKYCVERETPWGKKFVASKNLDELREKSKDFMVRRPKKLIVSQLPALVRKRHYVSLEITKLLEEGLDDIDAIVEAVESGAPLESDHITTVRKNIGLSKVTAILDLIQATLEEAEQVVVFVHHREVYMQIQEWLDENKITHVGINGLTPSEVRQISVDRFQKKEVQVFLASLKAANTGITLTSAHRLIMGEFDWVPSTNEQAEGRIYRLTQDEICQVEYVVCEKSLDEKVLDVVQRKQKNIDKVMGD